MATTLKNGGLTVTPAWDYRNADTVGTTISTGQFSTPLALVDGTAAGQAKTVYRTTLTIAASASATIDLNAAVTDVFGLSVALTRVQLMYIGLRSGGASSIAVGGGSDGTGTNAWASWLNAATDKVTVRGGSQGGVLALGCSDATGFPVTASTADILRITNNDGVNSATVDVLIVGV